jgi:hypothetical protein
MESDISICSREENNNMVYKLNNTNHLKKKENYLFEKSDLENYNKGNKMTNPK